MARKEIYAALEIADHEVRLVVGEMFDSRLNILRVERAAGGGVEKREINDEKAVVAAIRKAAADASAALGYRSPVSYPERIQQGDHLPRRR